jgi:hypothetical protein
MLVTMAAVWPVVAAAKGPVVGKRRAQLRRWFWCSAFSGSYDNAANSSTENDVVALRSWLDGGPAPGVVSEFSFQSDRWREVTGRQRALYASTMALLMTSSPRDFHDGSPLSQPIIEGRDVDDHHIFPRKFLEHSGCRDRPDTVLNHTLIGRVTNIRIGGRPPSIYLDEIAAEVGEVTLEQILRSHHLPVEGDGPLHGDRFSEFLDWRQAHLAQLLSEVTSS